MKKQLFSLAAVCLLFVGGLNAQSTDYSKWSIAVKGGADYFRIDPFSNAGNTGNGYLGFKGSLGNYLNQASWLAGVDVEYTLNPLFGIGLDVDYLNFNRNVGTGATIDPTLYFSTNISNLVSPVRKGFWAKSSLYADLGAGLSIYSGNANSVGDYDGYSPMMTATAKWEYNFNRRLALSLAAGYRTYFRQNLGGDWSTNVNNNDALTATIGLRFKLGSSSKTHVRDASVKDYFSSLYGSSDEALAAAQAANKKADDLAKKLDDLEKRTDTGFRNDGNEINAIKNKLKDLDNRLKNLEDDIKNSKENTTSFNDDLIGFEFGSSKLSSASFPTLDKIADILKANAGKKITVSGHTDNIGSDAYNQTLSVARATSVKNYLVKKGVPAASIIVQGFGESKPIANNNTKEGRAKNRRVDFTPVK